MTYLIKKYHLNLVGFLVFVFLSQSCVANELDSTNCTYNPQFKKLYKKLQQMKPVAAVQAIWDYDTKYKNTASCEIDLILSLLEKYEKQLFYIKSGALKIPSVSLYRCFEFDPIHTVCNGLIADDTAHYEMAGKPTLAVPKKRNIEIKTDFPGASLIAVYKTTVTRIFDQDSAIKLKTNSSHIQLPEDLEGHILIAMFKTTQRSWPYRKVIWFF